MILYDKNYNFLGISSETVSFLGYEDVSEFLSLNGDFADLLIEKEGKIYKFNNLSWIDFILYSGAPNKSAVVKQKDGTEVDIRLTVKEIILAKEFGGIDRCYAVRIINDNFVKIASKVNSNMQFQVNKNVSLSNLLTEPSAATLPKEEVAPAINSMQDESISLNFEEHNAKKSVEEEPISFDFPDPNELKKEIEDPIYQEDSKDSMEERADLEFDFTPKESIKSESVGEIELDFSNESAVLKSQQSESSNELDLGFLKIGSTQEPEAVEEAKESIETIAQSKNYEADLGFLKLDSQEKSSNTAESSLDFLKLDTTSEDTHVENKSDIIAQIKNDLDEIDQDSTQTKTLQEEEVIQSGSFVRKVFNPDIQKEESL